MRAFADSAEELHRGLAQRRLPTQASASFLAGLGRMSLDGWGGSAPSSGHFILLFLFLILTIVHISRKVSLKTNTHPEMYIWDYDKATEEMKPQVSCFK